MPIKGIDILNCQPMYTIADFYFLFEIIVKEKYLLRLKVWLKQTCLLFSDYVGSSGTAIIFVPELVKHFIVLLEKQ